MQLTTQQAMFIKPKLTTVVCFLICFLVYLFMRHLFHKYVKTIFFPTINIVSMAQTTRLERFDKQSIGENLAESSGDVDKHQDLSHNNSHSANGIELFLSEDFSYESLLIQENDNAATAEEKYFSSISHLDVSCPHWYRAGYKGEGGWNICIEGRYKATAPCLVYSFGIGSDFSFDDAMALIFNCTVRSFDPSTPWHKRHRSSGVEFYAIGLGETNVQKGKWKLETLKTLLENFQETNRTLDVLKMDIEHNEWAALRTILKDNTLAQVKQLTLETHVRNKGIDAEEMALQYKEYIGVLHEVRKQGFAMWSSQVNPSCQYLSKFTGKNRDRCNELGFLNMKYILQ